MASSKLELKKDLAYRQLLQMILDGSIGDRFPSEPILSAQLGVSRVTLRSALDRLAAEGLISRSHYYGTRIASTEQRRRMLVVYKIATGIALSNHALRITSAFDAHLKTMGYESEAVSYHFLQSHEKISENYGGVLFFGAGLTGEEPFLDVLKSCSVPVVFNREDHENLLSGVFSSVGNNMPAAWWSGYDYLFKLGNRRIATLLSEPLRNKQRLGYSAEEISEKLALEGHLESSGMVFCTSPQQCEEAIIRILRRGDVEVIYCYSGYMAAQAYRVIKERGLRIPQDIAVLSFGAGSNLMTPSLSSVDLNYALCGIAEAELILKQQANPGMKPIDVEIPHSIVTCESTKCIKL